MMNIIHRVLPMMREGKGGTMLNASTMGGKALFLHAAAHHCGAVNVHQN